jgi:hypothetical protein
MSSALAGYVSGKLRLRNAGLPSAFQVRFGGAKGTRSVTAPCAQTQASIVSAI